MVSPPAMAVSALIVGLGNPGPRYAATRHNFGFMVLDALMERARELGGAPKATLTGRKDLEAVTVSLPVLPGGAFAQVACLKPLTFMNLSGDVLPALMRPAGMTAKDLIVVADDVNLPLGKLRIRARGSAGGHNGLKSVIERVGTEEFVLVRVGVGDKEDGKSLKEHVLERMPAEERQALAEAAARAADAVECILVQGVDSAMNRFN